MENIYYFGTSFTEYGHYIFDITTGFIKIGLNFKNLPFNPEELTNNLSKGEIIYYQGGGYTVIGISGSCIDHRNGTKSIFWIADNLTKMEIIEKIKNNLIASKIINNMPFEIKWFKNINLKKIECCGYNDFYIDQTEKNIIYCRHCGKIYEKD